MSRQFEVVTQPLALIYYQKLLPGSTLANRLRDLNYRVHAAADLVELVSVAQSEGPMVVVLDLGADGNEVLDAIRRLRSDSKTGHVPILAFTESEQRQEAARTAGASSVTSDAAISTHFQQLLEQVLRLD